MDRLSIGCVLGIASVAAGMGIARLERESDTSILVETAPVVVAEDEAAIDALLTDLYACISGPKGQERDWETFDRVFLEDARMAAYFGTPDGNNGSMILTPAEYKQRVGPRLVETGFAERETHRVLEVYGHIAHAFSTYQGAYDGGIMETSVEGINSIQLVKTGEGWKVRSLIWQQASDELPVPERYLPEDDGPGDED